MKINSTKTKLDLNKYLIIENVIPIVVVALSL